MNVRKFALISLVAASVAACSGQPANNQVAVSAPNGAAPAPASTPTSTPAPAASIEGEWRFNQPHSQQLADGIILTVSEQRQTYASGGRTSFSARIMLTNGEGGLTFRVNGTGTWSQQGSTLTENLNDVTVVPDRDNARARVGAVLVEGLYRASPAQVADIEELTANQLRIRDRNSGQVLTATR